MGPPAHKLCARRDDNRLIPRTSRSFATGAELPAEGILRPLGSSSLLPKVQPSFADGSAAPRPKGILPAQAPTRPPLGTEEQGDWLSRFVKIKFLEILRESFGRNYASDCIMKPENRKIFDEAYRVLAVESQRLTIQGVRSGEVLTIQTENPEFPLSAAEYPPGQLIALTDPSGALPN